MTETGKKPAGSRTGAGLQRVFTLIAGFLVIANAFRIGAHHRHFVLDHPMNVVWIVASCSAGVAVLLTNGAKLAPKEVWPWLGYGIVAAYFGFALQAGLNGGLLREIGGAPGLGGYLILGFGAAGAQTFGKWLVLRFLSRLGAFRSARRTLGIGLGVGLGFGLAEIVMLGENQIVRQVGMTAFPLVGIWERFVAVGLHVFSSAIIALAILKRLAAPIVVVVALHAFDDFVAGAVSGGLVHLPVVAVEGVFSAVTLVLWRYYRTVRDDGLADDVASRGLRRENT